MDNGSNGQQPEAEPVTVTIKGKKHGSTADSGMNSGSSVLPPVFGNAEQSGVTVVSDAGQCREHSSSDCRTSEDPAVSSAGSDQNINVQRTKLTKSVSGSLKNDLVLVPASGACPLNTSAEEEEEDWFDDSCDPRGLATGAQNPARSDRRRSLSETCDDDSHQDSSEEEEEDESNPSRSLYLPPNRAATAVQPPPLKSILKKSGSKRGMKMSGEPRQDDQDYLEEEELDRALQRVIKESR